MDPNAASRVSQAPICLETQALRRSLILVSSLLSLPLSPAFAQDEAAPQPYQNSDFLMMGAGLASLPDYEGSDDRRVVPVPGAIGRVGGFKFTVLGNRASLDLIPDRAGQRWDLQAGPVASVGFSRANLKDIKDPRMKALGRLGYSVELGGYVGIARTGLITSDYDNLSVSVSYRKDVADANGGATIIPSATYMTPLSRKAMVLIFGSATHVDRDYAQNYFSISPQQSARSGLPAYNARPGWKSWAVGGAGSVSLTGDLTGGLSLMGGVMYMRLLGSAAETPMTSIAGTRNQWLAGAGLAYTF
jgi:MipA family protein